MIRCVAVGTGFGLLVTGLQVASDANLRGFDVSQWMHLAWHWLPPFVASAAIIGTLAGFRGETNPRQTRARAVGSVPWAGFVAHAIACGAHALTLDPRTIGLIVTNADIAFGVACLVVASIWTFAWQRHVRLAFEAPSPSRRSVIIEGFACLVVIGIVRVGALPDPKPPGRVADHVIMIAIDGLDQDQLRPRFERGELPHLRQLIEDGASGVLSTFRPTLSPLIWTTIATGQSPARHGITDFIESQSKIPFTSNMRRVPALWSYLGDAGIEVGVVGWWATWPAEAVHGTMVSSSSVPDRGTNKGTILDTLDRQTHSDALMNEIRPLIAPAVRAGRETIVETLRRTPMQPSDDMQTRRFVAGWVFGADRIFAQAAQHIATRYEPQFLAVYFAATDTLAHLYCEKRNPDAASCQQPISKAYAETDRLVGQILSHATPDTTIVLLSDHGFDLARGHGGQGQLNGLAGVVALKGPGVRRGGEIHSASIYDIVPTVLALFGEPLPENLPGRPLLSAFEDDQIQKMAIRHGPAAKKSRHADTQQPIPAATDEAMKERLRVLGYIE